MRVQIKHDKGATRALRNVSTVFLTSQKVMTTLNTFLISDENTLKCDMVQLYSIGKKAKHMWVHVRSQNKIAAPSDYKSKCLWQLCTTFVQLTWLEHVTKSHWISSSGMQYKIKEGEIPSKFWEVRTLIVLTYERKNKHLLSILGSNFSITE